MACPKGFSCSDVGQGMPVVCPPGYVCVGGTMPSTACSAGTYCPLGSSVALICSAGTFNAAVAASVCQTCIPGAFCPPGSLIPTPCPIGYYSNSIGANASTSCVACTLPGKYCPVSSTNAMVDCPAGAFCASPAFLSTCPVSTCVSGVQMHAGFSSECILGSWHTRLMHTGSMVVRCDFS
jgi:hypothetical protein